MGFLREGLLAPSPSFFSREKYMGKYRKELMVNGGGWMVDGRW
jgi:hypothetical protein